jgi:hypothetical protein
MGGVLLGALLYKLGKLRYPTASQDKKKQQHTTTNMSRRRPTKCQWTAKNYHGIDNRFSTIDCCKKLQSAIVRFLWQLILMLKYDYYPCKSPHTHHGAACSKNGMTRGFRCLGRRALMSVPHHKPYSSRVRGYEQSMLVDRP